MCDLALVKSGLVTCDQQARFQAAAVPHSGDWLHALVITPGRLAKYQALNDVVASAFVSAGISVTKELVRLTRQDGM